MTFLRDSELQYANVTNSILIFYKDKNEHKSVCRDLWMIWMQFLENFCRRGEERAGRKQMSTFGDVVHFQIVL